MQSDIATQIQLKNITKKYGEHLILDNIDLQIREGDFICIFGKSGEGKSTILNIMGALENYDSGDLIICSRLNPVRSAKNREYLRREKIAYLFQNFALVENLTVEENMKLATKYSKVKDKSECINSALRSMRVLDKLKSKIYELSGGEQQRVAMARNMVKPFEILLADEPTGSLDYENKMIVIDALLRLNDEGKTIVVVSHDKDFEKIAKKSYMIENGSIKEIKSIV